MATRAVERSSVPVEERRCRRAERRGALACAMAVHGAGAVRPVEAVVGESRRSGSVDAVARKVSDTSEGRVKIYFGGLVPVHRAGRMRRTEMADAAAEVVGRARGAVR